MMEHLINIEETDDLVPTRTHPNIVQSINKNVHGFPPLLPESSIYKVHEGLHKVKPEAYEPMLLSIGPYHLRKSRLHAMKKHKLRYLHLLLERRKEESVERYFLELAKFEDKARKCYADPIDLQSSDEFVEMMLLDGCFIIEFFRKTTYESADNDDPIFNVDWMQWQIYRGLMLLENQLPYFVLSQLYDMTKDPEEGPFMKMVMSGFNYMLPKPLPNFNYVGTNDTQGINHLLHVVHILCCPLFEERISENSDNDEILDQMCPLSEERITEYSNNDEILDQLRPLCEERITENSDNDEILDQMRSVVELQEAGVKFEKVGKVYTFFNKKDVIDTVSLFDIKFNHGLMQVPCFKVDDSTDAFFRNLIAYEQHSSDVDPKYFTDFTSFMDELINSENDVKLLRHKGIIVNLLGDDKEVSDIFNKLGEGLTISSNFHYSDVRKKVNTHCEKPWNEMMATLRGNYFNNPWASISTVVAGVLLLLTLLQTIASFITL